MQGMNTAAGVATTHGPVVLVLFILVSLFVLAFLVWIFVHGQRGNMDAYRSARRWERKQRERHDGQAD